MTVKFEKGLLENVDNECEGLGCNRTDFVIEAVQEKLEGKREEQEPKPKESPKILKGVIIDDITEKKSNVIPGILIDDNGKQTELTKGLDGVLRPKIEESKEFIPTITNIKIRSEPEKIDNSKKPRIDHILDGDKYILEGKEIIT